MSRLPLDKMATQLEDIAHDLGSEFQRTKILPWDRMADAIEAITDALSIQKPTSNPKDKQRFVADYIKAVADADMDRPNINPYKLIDRSLTGNVVIPAGKITTVGQYAFSGLNANTIDLSKSGVTKIGNGAFMGCKARSILLPTEFQEISTECFSGCTNLTRIDFNNDVVLDLVRTFMGCSELVYVPIIKSKYTGSINGVFSGCIKLKKVILANVTAISADGSDNPVFGGCTSLEYVYLPDSVTQIGAGAFGGVPITCKVRCGFSEGTVSGFPANGGWAGNPNNLDIEYDVPAPTEYPSD